MFWMVVYFVVAYVSAGLALGSVILERRRRERLWAGDPRRGPRRRPPYRLAVALFLIPLIPYAAVALQTAAFLPTLRPALNRAMTEDYGLVVSPRIVRVLRVAPAPVVYAVLPCTGMGARGESGVLYTFHRVRGQWQWDGVPECAWSECGSAQGNTFPPYPEANEF
ncbi:MAG TPA: hypothetical protein VGM37_03475 [Armatimonadota bacterium]|jgi:hypothetical protein